MARRPNYNQNIDDNWNPMKDAYQDPSFNTYREGPGANLDLDKQPCYTGSQQNKTKTCRLYVGNIAPHIDEEGVENIFRNVGNPISVFRQKLPSTWAFVTFGSFREAENVRRELHRRPPMNFFIEYAKGSEPEDEHGRRRSANNFDSSAESETFAKTRNPVQNGTGQSGKGRGLAVAPYVDPRTPGPRVDSQENTNIRQFQQYSGSNYDESNTAVMRGVQRANGPGGPKKFVMGRGCFDSEMDQLCQPRKLGKVVDNVYEAKNSIEKYVQQRNGLYEYSQKEYPPGFTMGTCTYCREPSTQYCAQCEDWYCSKICQDKDWPRHQNYCGGSKVKNKMFEDASAQRRNLDQKYPVSPRKERSNGDSPRSQHKRDGYHPRNDSQEHSSSKQTIPSASHYSKGKEFGHSRNDSNGTGLEENCSSDLSKSRELPHYEKNKSPPNNRFPRSQGKEQKFPKKGIQNESRNGDDGAEDSFAKGSKSPGNPKRVSNEDKNIEEFQKVKRQGNNNFNGGRNISNKPKQTSPREKYNDEKISKSANNIKDTSKYSSKDTSKDHSVPQKPLMGCEEPEMLLDSCFTKVTVQVPVNSEEYWVQLTSNFGEVCSMSNTMEMAKEMASVKLSLGAYCMAKYENLWYRAKITTLQPKVKVFFIDFGNEEETLPEELKVIPDGVKDMKSQAIRIKLAPETSQKYHKLDFGAELSVKSVHRDKDGISTVQVEGEVYRHSSTENASANRVEIKQEENHIALQSIMVLLKSNMWCSLYIIEYNSEQEYLGCLVPFDMTEIYNSLFSPHFQEECDQLKSVNFMPKLGQPVVAKFENEGWLRAYVLHISGKEFTVASCDLGLVEVVKEVRKMPQKCREIAQFAVQCSALGECKLNNMMDGPRKILIENSTSDTAVGEVEDEHGEKCKIEMKKWDAPYELYEELKCVELKDGECVISAEMSPFELYIRPMTNSCIEIYNRLLQDVAKHCFTAEKLNYTPKVGQVLASKFTEDGNYYRAVVREVLKSKGVKVQYIDFGNVEYVPKDSLKPLPKILRDVECCVVKVVLADVIDRPLNEEVQRLFKELVIESVRLKLKLTDQKSNKVHLYTKDGTNLNETINNILIPGWKKGEVDDSIYTVRDVKTEELEAGKLVVLVIMSVIGKTLLVARPQESKLIHILQNDLQQAIDEYCEQKKEPYTPREMELCLALVDNSWRRCLCLSGGNQLSLYLIDDGRVRNVTHEYIRKYLHEFALLPAIGIHFEIKVTGDSTKDSEVQSHIKKYLTTMKIITAKVIGMSKNPMSADHSLSGYIITVPELDEYLQTLR